MVDVKHQTLSEHFVSVSRARLDEVAHSLGALYLAANLDPSQPQVVAKALGLNRTLTWKFSRVINASDAFSTLNHLPGQQGVDTLLTECRKFGAPAAACDRVRLAFTEFASHVRECAGDRESFDLMLQSMGLFEPEHNVESGLELAYRGNSMIWGVQARVRLCTLVVVPGSTADTVDCALIGSLLGFRRLRPSVRWRLFRLQMFDDKGGDILAQAGPEQLFPSKTDRTPYMLSDFCSPNMPDVEVVRTPEGREYLLPEGPVGLQSTFDAFYGYVYRGLPAFKDDQNSYGAAAASSTLPVQHLICDLLLHKRVPHADEFETQVFGYPHGGTDSPASQTIANLLPIQCPVTRLKGSPPSLATHLVPVYRRLMNATMEHLGSDPDDFVGVRAQMEYPPMGSRTVLRYPLCVRPDSRVD